MATTTTVPPYRHFHGEAHVLSGHLRRPIEQRIEKHAEIVLRDQKDGHLTRFTEQVDIEGLVSFKSGRTRVSGSRSLKNDPKNHGFVTVATSVVEGLNVFEVITADRIVAQVSTDYPMDSGRKDESGNMDSANYPHVTFLGTHFDNVRVNGGLLTLKLNFGIIGEREGDTSYLSHPSFVDRAREQTKKLANAKDLPEDLRRVFADRLKAMDNLKGSSKPEVTFSIVENIDNLDEIPIPGAKVVGHVLILPQFGTVSLGEVNVSEVANQDRRIPPSNYFELTMLQVNLGCVGHGTVTGAVVATNGGKGPPQGGG